MSDAAKGADGGVGVHGATARHFAGHAYYEYSNGQMRNGLSNCVFMLRPMSPGDGGFGVVPVATQSMPYIRKKNSLRQMVYSDHDCGSTG